MEDVPTVNKYYASLPEDPDQITIHVAYETITDEDQDHRQSPHMRQRITGVLAKHFPEVFVSSSSQNIHEALRICRMKRPKIAIVSIRLHEENNVTFYQLLNGLREIEIIIVIAYKESEAKSGDKKILGLKMVTPMRVKKIETDFGIVLSALE